MQQLKKTHEKKINADAIHLLPHSKSPSSQTELLLKQKQYLLDDIKYFDHSQEFVEYKIDDSDQKQILITSKEKNISVSVEQLYQQAVDFLYRNEYIDAFSIFNSLSVNNKKKYVQIKWESCLFKTQILSRLRRFEEALDQVNKLEKEMEASSDTSKLTLEIQLVVYQVLLLICINKVNDAKSLIKNIEDNIPLHFTNLMKFFIDTDAKQTEAELFDIIEKAKFVDQWIAAAEDGSMECTVLNGLYLWLGLILVTREQYSLSEYYFKKILPTVYQFDSQKQEYQIYPLDQVDISYETHLQLLLNKKKKNEFQAFINMIEKEKTYINRKEIAYLKIYWLAQGIYDINDNNISQYAGLTLDSLTFIRQSYDPIIITKFYYQVMAKFEALFAHLYIHQYNNEFAKHKSLDQYINESSADCLLLWGELDSAAIQYGHATTTQAPSADISIAARAHFKRYALSYVKSFPQLNRDSIQKVLSSYADKSYFECAQFIAFMSQIGMQLIQFDKNKTKIPKNHEVICLQWIGIILFHKNEHEESIKYFNSLIEKFPKANSVVLAKLYKARAHAKLGEKKDSYDIFSELIDYQRKAYRLKYHDLELIRLECEYDLAFKANDLKYLIDVYDRLIQLKQTLKKEYAIHQYHYLDNVQKKSKKSIVDLLNKEIISSINILFQKEPTGMFSLKKSKNADFDKKWVAAIFSNIQDHFSAPIHYDSLSSLIYNLYDVYKTTDKWNDKVKDQVMESFTKFIKQQAEAKKVIPDPVPAGLLKKDLFKKNLAEELEQGFDNAKSYKNGFVPDTSFDAKDKAKLLLMAASFLPLGKTFSQSCIGVSLFVGIAGDIYNLLKGEQAKDMSDRVLELLPPGYKGRDISDFCDSVSLTVGNIYSEQIEKLDIASHGIPLFAKQVATIMLWYIATSEGRRSGLLNIGDKIREHSLMSIAALLKISIPKEKKRNSVSKMVVGLFFAPLPRKTSERLLLATDDKVVDKTNPWTGEGVIRRTAVEINSQVYVLPEITQFKKYGSIKAPEAVTEEWLKQQHYQRVTKGYEDSVDDLKDKGPSCFVM